MFDDVTIVFHTFINGQQLYIQLSKIKRGTIIMLKFIVDSHQLSIHRL